ncbi:MAG TPA: sugar kinase [Bacillota bacterium]|nr:sugar kinase [Bacillota bacterium]
MDHHGPVVLCVGETMALLTPQHAPAGLWLDVHQAGAEGNVAAGLAHLGCRSRWLSRLGDDEFAPVITDFLASRGVDVAQVVTDPERPTGLMTKSVSGTGTDQRRTRVRYARAGSAASGLSPDDLTAAALDRVTVCHLSGITPALSDSCADLVEAVVVERRLGPGITVSFDVNHRPALWADGAAGPTLHRIAAAADVVLVGLDEARELWGCRTPGAVRDLLPEPRRLVVKDGAVAAHAFVRSDDGTDHPVVQPALRAEVVEAVGAGDAFAAGYLAGLVAPDPGVPAGGGGAELRALRLGHALAACTLQSMLDLPAWPSAEVLRSWTRLDETGWRQLHVTPADLEGRP